MGAVLPFLFPSASAKRSEAKGMCDKSELNDSILSAIMRCRRAFIKSYKTATHKGLFANSSPLPFQ